MRSVYIQPILLGPVVSLLLGWAAGCEDPVVLGHNSAPPFSSDASAPMGSGGTASVPDASLGNAGAGTTNANAGNGGSSGSVSANGGFSGVSGASGGTTGGGASGTGSVTNRSCVGLAPTCGPNGDQDCCASSLVPGGTFYRSYDGVSYLDKSNPATVSDFELDTYEITVGRFRKFVAAYSQDMIAQGAGKNPNNPSDTGWDTAWNASLDTDAAALTTAHQQNPAFHTWTDTPGDALAESRPINELSWFEAEAFCIWDGGRLPTEAEWNYAAAGGSEQRAYPWGNTDPGADAKLADYFCYYPNGGPNGTSSIGVCTGVANLTPVGSIPAGNGKWGQADLAGSVSEWVQDWYADPYPNPCTDCAELAAAQGKVFRGGAFGTDVLSLAASERNLFNPSLHFSSNGGARCARPARGSSSDAGSDASVDAGEGGPDDAGIDAAVAPLGGVVACAGVAAFGTFSGVSDSGELLLPGQISPAHAALASDGSLWVTGSFTGTVTFGPTGVNTEPTLSSNGQRDLFVARYSSDCKLIWVRREGGAGNELGLSIAPGYPTGAFVVGSFDGAPTFDDGLPTAQPLVSAGKTDVLIAAFADDGTLVWARSAGGPDADTATSIDFLPGNLGAFGDNTLRVTGTIGSAAIFGAGEPKQTTLGSAGALGPSLFIAKYIDDGSLTWARQTTSADTGSVSPAQVVVDSTGDSYVVGNFRASATFGSSEPNATTITSALQGSDTPPATTYTADAFLAHYLADGTFDWVRTVSGGGDDRFAGIAVNAASNQLFVSGQFGDSSGFVTSTLFGAGEPGALTIQSNADLEAFAAGFRRGDGAFQWLERASGGATEDLGGPIAAYPIPATGSVQAGLFGGLNDPLLPQDVTFGKGEPNQTQLFSRDYASFVARYGTDGKLAWARPVIGGSLAGRITGLVAAADGSSLAVGSFSSSLTIAAGYTDEITLTNPDLEGAHSVMYIAGFGP